MSTEAIRTLAEASPTFLLAMFIVGAIWAIKRNLIYLPREIRERDKRISELEAEKAEYKGLLFRAVNIGERVAAVAEERK